MDARCAKQYLLWRIEKQLCERGGGIKCCPVGAAAL